MGAVPDKCLPLVDFPHFQAITIHAFSSLMFNLRSLPGSKLRSMLFNGLLVVLSLITGLAISEVALRHQTGFPIHAPNGNRVFDDRLLYRMDTNLAGVDRAGFRNPESYPDQFPKIAAVGDSFTYGFNVSREASWPGRLESLIGERVYNFGIGGYSLLQYVELVRRAAESGAKTIIVGLLPENDMSVCDAARLTHWDDVMNAGGQAGDLSETFCFLRPENRKPSARELLVDPKFNETLDLETWLLYNSALFSSLQYAADAVINRRDNLSRNRFFDHDELELATRACADPAEDFVFPVFAAQDFIPGFHKNDLQYFKSWGKVDNVSRALFRRTIESMRDAAKSGQAELLFLIIPGRRFVVANFLAMNSPEVSRPDWIVSLADSEARLVTMMKEELAALDLPTTDALPHALASYERTVRSGRPHYPCYDGHPLEDGYAALAAATADLYRIRKDAAAQ